MKYKITIDGKSKEYKVSDHEMTRIMQRNPSIIFKNRKKYTRKEKHKKDLRLED